PENGKFSGAEHDVLLGVEENLSTVVVLHHPGLDVLVRYIPHRVHVGDKADDRSLPVGYVGWQGAVHIAMLVHVGICNAQAEHFLNQSPGEVQLLRCAGAAGAGAIRCCRVVRIPQKPLVSPHCSSSLYYAVLSVILRGGPRFTCRPASFSRPPGWNGSSPGQRHCPSCGHTSTGRSWPRRSGS